ncbi:MAG: hypothetical protein ACFE0I_04060 [Elainellaceae cyanobacterium]
MNLASISAASVALAGVFAGATALALLGPLPVSAQQAESADPLEGFQTQDGSRDPFSGEGASQGDVFNLIHRAILSNGVSMDEYSRQQRENLGSAAEDFRSRQRQLLNQSAPQPDADVVADPSEESN